MFRNLLVATSLLAVAAVAEAEITDVCVEPQYAGYLSDSATHVFSFDLMVGITGDDAWTVAGGPALMVPWVTVTGATFYQDPMGSIYQPDPDLFPFYPDLQYDSFYTTHLGWPNTPDRGVIPGLMLESVDLPTELIAEWYWTPDGNYYPGDFIIARFTVVAPPDADPASTYADIDVLVGSLMTAPIRYQVHVPIPEPTSLVLLALAASALVCRRCRASITSTHVEEVRC
jgi:hypothetical protein